MNSFWMVWNNKGRAPKKRHATVELAQAEAERLSAEHPYAKFYVLAGVAVVGPKLEQPKKEKGPPQPELTPEERAERKAAKEAKRIERQAAYDAEQAKKAPKPVVPPEEKAAQDRQKQAALAAKPPTTLAGLRKSYKQA